MTKYKVELIREDDQKWEKEIEAESFQRAGAISKVYMPRGFGNGMRLKTFVDGKLWLMNA